MSSTPTTARLHSYRFSPWWVNAITVVPLALAAAVTFSLNVWFGTVIGLIVLSFVVSASIIAAIAVPILSRSIGSILASTHARLALFGALTVCWIAAWVLGMFLSGIVGLIAFKVSLAQPGVDGSATSGYSVAPGVLAYSAPVLLFYIAVSGLLSRTLTRRHS